jgi:D-methionine transport system ATP-binding protein
MAVIRQICTRVAIIDEGRIAEKGDMREVFAHPKTAAARRLFLGAEEELPPGKRCVRIAFGNAETHEPVVANMILACGVPVNILSSDIQSIGGQQRGQMLIELPGDPGGAKRALDYLNTQANLTLEEVSVNECDGAVDHDSR